MKPAPLSPAEIEVRIEELVLHGFAPGGRWEIADALAAELRRLLVTQGIPAAWQANPDRLEAGPMRAGARTHTGEIGEGIARAVYDGRGGEPR